MKKKISKEKEHAAVLAFFHVILSFYSDKYFFIDYQSHVPLVILLKMLLFVVLYFAWYMIVSLISNRNEKVVQISTYAIPCFFLLLVFMFRFHLMELTADELNIYLEAIQYNIFPYQFIYFTGLLYVLSFMIFPFQMGIVIVKIILQSLVCGYCVYRAVKFFKKKGLIMYLLFALYGVLENGIMAHRLQFYGLLYLFIIVKLTFDVLEHKQANIRDFIILMLSFAVLAFWRKEGIYLLMGAPLVLCTAYSIKKVRNVVKVTLCFLLLFSVLYTPELLLGKKFTHESIHTYITWFVHMSREGLDHEKYPEEIEAVDQYLSIEAVNRLNETFGDDNYQDNFISWREGYVGIQESYTAEDMDAMKSAVVRLILKEPVIYLKTRIGIWLYGAGQLNLDTLRAALITIGRNLNIPLLSLVFVCIFSLFAKKWMHFFISGMLLANLVVTTLLSPAAYFKYYYHQFLIGWMYILLGALFLLSCLDRKYIRRNTNE